MEKLRECPVCHNISLRSYHYTEEVWGYSVDFEYGVSCNVCTYSDSYSAGASEIVIGNRSWRWYTSGSDLKDIDGVIKRTAAEKYLNKSPEPVLRTEQEYDSSFEEAYFPLFPF